MVDADKPTPAQVIAELTRLRDAAQTCMITYGPHAIAHKNAAHTAACLTAALALVEWRGMESAPKDGTKVDLWVDGRRYTDCHWYRGNWIKWIFDNADDDHSWKVVVPTGWMPIPTPPTPDGIAARKQLETDRG